MKNNFFIFLFLIFFSCQKPHNKKENVLFNKDSDEIVFILELSSKENSVEDIEDFTQYLSDFIVKREPSTVYGYFISEDGKNVTLIERYNNSEDGIQHGKDFINGPNFEKLFSNFGVFMSTCSHFRAKESYTNLDLLFQEICCAALFSVARRTLC